MIELTDKIGVFDTGIGGLTVLSALKKHIPDGNFVYLGDNYRMPYEKQIPQNRIDWFKQSLNFLKNEQGAKILVIACNTLSTLVPQIIDDPNFYDVKIVEMIEPTVEFLIQRKNNINPLIIFGSPTTIASNLHKTKLVQEGFRGEIFTFPCPDLAATIEFSYNDKNKLINVFDKCLEKVKQLNAEGVLLACTHYPLITGMFSDRFPNSEIYNPADAVAMKVNKEINYKPTKKSLASRGSIKLFFTQEGTKEKNIELLKTLFGEDNLDFQERILFQK